MAQAIASLEGIASVGVAAYPGVIMTDTDEELSRKTREVLVKDVVRGLLHPVDDPTPMAIPGPEEIVARGSFDEIQDRFEREGWTDGLPIVPPTPDRVLAFLERTPRSPDDLLGALPPSYGHATVQSVAVNGVMAGCSPESMPLLIAAVEAIADPVWQVQHAGSTPGWEALAIVSGPAIRRLDFNTGAGVMRIGRRANSTLGRFLRLYLRNVAGLRIPPGATDKAAIGTNFNVALAEDEPSVTEIGWATLAQERGFGADESVVTVMGVLAISPPIYSAGDGAASHLAKLARDLGALAASWTQCAFFHRSFPALVVMSPSVAGVLARAGLSKADVRAELGRLAQVPREHLERNAWEIGGKRISLDEYVRTSVAPVEYGSAVRRTLVPAFPYPEQIEIVVAGDRGRNQSRGYLGTYLGAPPISRLAT